jgi:hypothetical protein
MNGKLLFGLVSGMVAIASAGMSSGASADTTVTICAAAPVGQMQHCEYSRPNGIKSIFITNVAPDGTQVIVWNEVYDCESPVDVSYVVVGPTGFFEIEECDPPVGVGGGDAGSFQVKLPPPPEPELGLKGEPSQADAAGPVIPVEDADGFLWLCREDEEAQQSICIRWPQPEKQVETPLLLKSSR